MSDRDELITKISAQGLTNAEQLELAQVLMLDLEELRISQPEKYIALLRELNAAISSVNKAITQSNMINTDTPK